MTGKGWTIVIGIIIILLGGIAFSVYHKTTIDQSDEITNQNYDDPAPQL